MSSNQTSKLRQPTRFSHIHLENWRNFAKVEIDLPNRVFLFGPNASGKSNFLDVFRFLHDIVSAGGGFEEAVTKRGGVSRIRCLAARRQPDVVIHVKVLGKNDGPTWEYQLHFAQDTQRVPAQRIPKIKMERVLKDDRVILERPLRDDKRDPEQLRQTHLEQVRANRKFRELADFFESVAYLHIVPQLIRDTERYRGQLNDPFGWDIIERVNAKPKHIRNAWLNRIGDALRVALPQLQELNIFIDKRGVPHLRGRYEHWRAKGAWQTEEAFSDGTLRLFGLLWSTLERSGPLLLEEPEMSLHPDVVRFIPSMLARMQRRTDRQVLVSSHSSDLLRDEGIGLDEVLILRPTDEGTEVSNVGSFGDVKILLESGSSLADVVIPRTRPKNAHQLSLWGD